MRINFFAAAVLIAGGLLSGCAFGERQASLGYPPAEDANAGGTAQAAPAPTARGTVYLETFNDVRSDKTVVGHVRNGFGMKTAEVVAQKDVPAWVREALVYELEAAGYRVQDGGDVPVGAATMSGDILRVYCDAYFTYDGEVTLRIETSKDGQALMNQTFTGTGSAGISWAATGDSYSQSLSLALRATLRQVLSVFDALDI